MEEKRKKNKRRWWTFSTQQNGDQRDKGPLFFSFLPFVEFSFFPIYGHFLSKKKQVGPASLFQPVTQSAGMEGGGGVYFIDWSIAAKRTGRRLRFNGITTAIKKKKKKISKTLSNSGSNWPTRNLLLCAWPWCGFRGRLERTASGNFSSVKPGSPFDLHPPYRP